MIYAQPLIILYPLPRTPLCPPLPRLAVKVNFVINFRCFEAKLLWQLGNHNSINQMWLHRKEELMGAGGCGLGDGNIKITN